MDKFKVLGLDLANRIQDCKDQMFIGSLREIKGLHEELLLYRVLLEKLPLEDFKTVEMMVRLRKMELSIQEMSIYPDTESREDYKLKKEEIGRYLASIKTIVGRKVTASYRRKIGLCS